MIKLVSTFALSAVIVLAAAIAQAASLKDIKVASCKNPNGAFLELDATTQVLRGRVAHLQEMSNVSADGAKGGPIEWSKGWPASGLSHLGALVVDKAGYLGSLSLVAPSEKQLNECEKLTLFFTDTVGISYQEDVTCQLTFR